MAADDGPQGSFSRRSLLGLAGGLTLTLSGCGSVPSQTNTVPEVDAADALVLDGLLANENRAVAAYAHAASLLTGRQRVLAQRIRLAEAAHVYALTGAIYRLRGTPTPAPHVYAFAARDGPGALVLAREVEDVSIAGSIDALANLSDVKARGIVVAVANSDAQHAVLIAQARGLPPIPVAIVRGQV